MAAKAPAAPRRPAQVSKHTWRKWDRTGRVVYTELYSTMLSGVLDPPSVSKVNSNARRVLAHNAAFVAADAVRMVRRGLA